jgi:hypothetical protein
MAMVVTHEGMQVVTRQDDIDRRLVFDAETVLSQQRRRVDEERLTELRDPDWPRGKSSFREHRADSRSIPEGLGPLTHASTSFADKSTRHELRDRVVHLLRRTRVHQSIDDLVGGVPAGEEGRHVLVHGAREQMASVFAEEHHAHPHFDVVAQMRSENWAVRDVDHDVQSRRASTIRIAPRCR